MNEPNFRFSTTAHICILLAINRHTEKGRLFFRILCNLYIKQQPTQGIACFEIKTHHLLVKKSYS